ncbi:hypothetical protein [Sphingomonas sp. PB4P5]|uniref:hypothetical protein n=1 Tax=Parasphingomonas puruogangriensis TaxID=3096155 RepID=UPI002FC62C26
MRRFIHGGAVTKDTQVLADAEAFLEAHGDGWQAALMPMLVEAAVCTDRQEALRWFRLAAVLQKYEANRDS